VTALSREALDSLLKYSYPGNVRELENIVEQFVVLSRSPVIMRDDLPMRVREYHPDLSGSRESQGSLVEQVEAFEQAMITDALRSAGQVQTRAAEILGISERHLRYKLRKYGMK
jgi:two-component system NtrC family response regulator